MVLEEGLTGESGNSNPVLVRKAGQKGSVPKQTIDQLFDDIAKRKRFCPE